MKFLVLLFLVGCASSASLYNVLDDAAEEHDLLLAFENENGLYLKEALGLFDDQLYGDDDDDVTTEMHRKMREAFARLLESIKKLIENKGVIGENLQARIKKIVDWFIEKKVDVGERAKEILRNIRDKVPQNWRDLIDKLLNRDEKSMEGDDFDEALLDFNIKDLFKSLKDYLKTKVDKEKLKAKIEELFGKGNDMADKLLEILKEKGDQWKQKLLDLVDRYLGKDKRSVGEYWEKVKKYFKDLGLDLKEKFMKFGEWVKERKGELLDKGKSKLDNIKAIAKELIDHAKQVSKDVAEEALEFLRPYKDDLGSLWNQLKDTLKDIANKKD